MKDYKLIASKIERFTHSDYVKARIYLEIQDLDASPELIDAFVEEAYNWYTNSDSISPEQLGLAIWLGYTSDLITDKTDIETVILYGLDNQVY
jgi:hypothetical protein